MKKINLCFDGRLLKNGLVGDSGRSGIYFVVRNLLFELFKNEHINLFVYFEDKDFELLNKLNENLNLELSKQQVLLAESDYSAIDVFFSPAFKIPDIIKQNPQISCYTILYDVIPLMFPKYFKGMNHQSWFKQLFDTLNNEDYYFAISDYTKADFLKYDPLLDADKMTTIPLSTNQIYKPNKNQDKLAEVKNKYNIPADKKYLFSLCSLEPRKNLIRAVKNFIEFIKKNKVDDLVYVLGGSAWQGFIEKFEQEVPDYKQYANKIIRAGYVADEDLEILYSNAEWFVYTSQYEGFGMPPLEAMACGCPVITSNNSSLPEVVGNAGIMIDYDSDEQHVKAYEKYYFDEKYRQKMAQKGFERSKLFSWNAAADIIVKKMQEVEKKKAHQPLVTIVTATYNLLQNGREETFKQCVESVQKQTYPNIEHIVIDGASTDGTLDMLQKYKDQGWIQFYSEPDKGIYDAMNKGILKAKGKYVICLNSDDFYCNDKAVELLVKKAEETDADAAYGNAIRVNPQTLQKISSWNGKEVFYPLFGSCPCYQTLLIKTSVMKELGLYDLQYKVSSDNNFMCRMVANNKKFAFANTQIIVFREGGFSDNYLELSESERIMGFYYEYGQYHHLSYYDCQNLFAYSYVNLPLDEAIRLGNKLEVATWRDEYFKRLFEHYNNANNVCLSAGIIPPQYKPRKTKYKLFGLLPILTVKHRSHKTVYKFLGLPLLKIKINSAKNKKKYYICGLLILKVIRR